MGYIDKNYPILRETMRTRENELFERRRLLTPDYDEPGFASLVNPNWPGIVITDEPSPRIIESIDLTVL